MELFVKVIFPVINIVYTGPDRTRCKYIASYYLAVAILFNYFAISWSTYYLTIFTYYLAIFTYYLAKITLSHYSDIISQKCTYLYHNSDLIISRYDYLITLTFSK